MAIQCVTCCCIEYGTFASQRRHNLLKPRVENIAVSIVVRFKPITV